MIGGEIGGVREGCEGGARKEGDDKRTVLKQGCLLVEGSGRRFCAAV